MGRVKLFPDNYSLVQVWRAVIRPALQDMTSLFNHPRPRPDQARLLEIY